MNFKLIFAVIFAPVLLGCIHSSKNFHMKKYSFTFKSPTILNAKFRIEKIESHEEKNIVNTIAVDNKKQTKSKKVDKIKIRYSSINKKFNFQKSKITKIANKIELKNEYKNVEERIHSLDLKEVVEEEKIELNNNVAKLNFDEIIGNIKLPKEELIAKTKIIKDSVNEVKAAQNKTDDIDLEFYDYSDLNKNEQKEKIVLDSQKSETENKIVQIQEDRINTKLEVANNKDIQFQVSFPKKQEVNIIQPKNIEIKDAIKEIMKDQTKKQTPVVAANVIQNDYSNILKSDEKNINSKMNIQIQEVKIGYSKKESKNFQISYLDDYKEVDEDYSTGIIKIQKNINGEKQIRESLVQSFNKETYITRTEIVFEKGEFEIIVPVFDIQSLSRLNNLNYYDSYMIVELDETTEDVELSNINNKKTYFKKIFLDEEFKEVEQSVTDYRYVLFVGIKPGNRIVNYKNGSELKSRIVFINENEVFFESINYKKENRDEIKLLSKDILTKIENILDISPENFISLQNEKSSLKKNLNTYYFKENEYLLNSRKYYEIQRDDKSVFIGRENSKKVIVPNEIFINEIITRFNIENIKERCIIQLNLSKNIKDISFDGMREKYNIELNSFAIDDQGQIIDHADIYTKNFFIKGDVGVEGGVISIKINYIDETTDYIKSFCSPNTYLVEQL